MSEEETFKIPKPPMRRLHNAVIKRNLITAIALVTVAVVAIKKLRNDPRKRDYAEFYKNNDASKAFQRMKNAGLLQSVKD
ncbi:cytochrome c oxidase subunit 6C-like [Anopheles maculipalpis]|uniref:cytochrome c oxidase subunit 6C-like n=1 Tax=Anopheles maculipalpis TaxID=1496333 RepID=UPI0021594913|nr:cytochrome c oxidase subunit 6C-like [Anopheles maculipalpis]